MQEHLTIFSSITLDLDLSVLILGIVFDDFREEGVRFDVAEKLNNKKLQNIFLASEIGSKILSDTMSNTDVEDEFSALNNTFQEKSEKFLNSFLERNSDIWASRPQLRGYVFNAAYRFRNYVFQINPSTKRKMILPRYVGNWRALQEILRQTKNKGIQSVIYVAPIRNDVEIPYVEEEYATFKVELSKISEEYGAQYLNLESLVNAEDWGLKDSTGITGSAELDFILPK